MAISIKFNTTALTGARAWAQKMALRTGELVIPHRDGVSIEHYPRRDARVVTIDGRTTAATAEALRTLLDAIEAELATGRGALYLHDDRYLNAVLRTWDLDYLQNALGADWAAAFICDDPYYYSTTAYTITDIPIAVTLDKELVYTGYGNAPFYPVLTFTPSGGSATEVTLTNTKSLKSIKFEGTVEDGKALAFDMSAKTVTNADANALAGVTGEFFSLSPTTQSVEEIIYSGESQTHQTGNGSTAAVARVSYAVQGVDVKCPGLTQANGTLTIDLWTDTPASVNGQISGLEINTAGVQSQQELERSMAAVTTADPLEASTWKTYTLPLSAFTNVPGTSLVSFAPENGIKWVHWYVNANGSTDFNIKFRNPVITYTPDEVPLWRDESQTHQTGNGSTPAAARVSYAAQGVDVKCPGLTQANGTLTIDLWTDTPASVNGMSSGLEINTAGVQSQQELERSMAAVTTADPLAASTWKTYTLPLSAFTAVPGTLGVSFTPENGIKWVHWFVNANGAVDFNIKWRNARIVYTDHYDIIQVESDRAGTLGYTQQDRWY